MNNLYNKMKSSPIMKSKSPKQNLTNIAARRPKNYLNKNLSKKYIYKKEKATDTDKVLQNNKISKNIVFSPSYNKEKEGIQSKHILNNSNCDLRRGLEIRDDVNIDYEKYQQQQSFFLNSPSIPNYNPIRNNSNLINQSYFLMNKKNGYITNSNTNRNNNKWKCPQCGNVNSNFNYLCNNCNMPNTTSLDQNNSILVNQRNNSSGKNLEAISLDKNIINNSFNSISINNSSHNLLSKSINNNSIMKKQILKKNSTNANLHSNITNYNANSNLINPYYSNIGLNTIRNNKNNNKYFYSGANMNINANNSMNSNNIYETERDSNITHLYSYSNYLANELKSSNDTNLKLLENYQNNESEYNNNYQQNDLIKKKIKILKEKENQLDKINEQLQKSLSFIKQKYDNKNGDDVEGNNYVIKTIIGEQSAEQFKSKIKEFTEENEKLSDKLKENKDMIIKLKTKIGELSDDKKNNKTINIDNKQNQKINQIKELKEDISNFTKEIREQNQQYNSLDKENNILAEKIKMLKKQINDEDNNNNNNNNNDNNNNNNTINNNKNKNAREIKSIPISMNTEKNIEKEKYIKNKEKNNQLAQFLEELNKMGDDKGIGKVYNNKDIDYFNKLKEIYLNLDKKNLMEIINDDDNNEKEMIEFIDDYMNILMN